VICIFGGRGWGGGKYTSEKAPFPAENLEGGENEE